MSDAPAAPKAKVSFQAEVSKITDHTKNIRELHLKMLQPNTFVFKAGQFLMLQVPHEPKPLTRAYSIASSDLVKDQLKLIFKYVPQGVASDYVWKLKTSDQVRFTGPFGKVLFHEPLPDQIIFLCTGSGIAQHICFLESKLSALKNIDTHLLLGVPNESEIFFKNELGDLKAQLPRFSFEFVVSQPASSWTGLKGYVQSHITRFGYLQKPTHFYLCGNGLMIKETRELLKSQNFPAENVIFEAFD